MPVELNICAGGLLQVQTAPPPGTQLFRRYQRSVGVYLFGCTFSWTLPPPAAAAATVVVVVIIIITTIRILALLLSSLLLFLLLVLFLFSSSFVITIVHHGFSIVLC